GSARNPLNEYVFPEDVYNQRKMERIFALVEKYCFQGHTHVPGIFTEGMQFLAPEEIEYTYKLDGRKTLCNVGSVGQPRDGDPRRPGELGSSPRPSRPDGRRDGPVEDVRAENTRPRPGRGVVRGLRQPVPHLREVRRSRPVSGREIPGPGRAPGRAGGIEDQ